MLASLTAFAITSAARLLTGARALWLGCTAQPTQRLYFANHSSHGDFVLLWASLPPELRRRTRPVAGSDYWMKGDLRRFLIRDMFNGVLVDRDRSVLAAGGYLIQLLPGATEDTIVKVEGGIMAAGPVSAILDRDPDPEHLLRTVMSDFELKILETCPVSYKCYCSRQRVERALLSLGADELEGILREQGSCHMTCQFCDAVYDFSADELRGLLKNL